jgi:hypothetical protein
MLLPGTGEPVAARWARHLHVMNAGGDVAAFGVCADQPSNASHWMGRSRAPGAGDVEDGVRSQQERTLRQFNQWLLDAYKREGASLRSGSRRAICVTQPICGLQAAVARWGLRSGVLR